MRLAAELLLVRLAAELLLLATELLATGEARTHGRHGALLLLLLLGVAAGELLAAVGSAAHRGLGAHRGHAALRRQ